MVRDRLGRWWAWQNKNKKINLKVY